MDQPTHVPVRRRPSPGVHKGTGTGAGTGTRQGKRQGGRRAARGVTLLELLGALAILAMLAAGAAALVQSGIDDTRGQHAGQHQATAVDATERYVRLHYAELVASTAAGPAAMSLGDMRDLLPEGFRPENAFGQVPCARILQPQAGKLQVLVIAEGGESIPARDVGYIAAHAGRGAGQIVQAEPGVAQGAFGAWRLDLAPYAVGCDVGGPGLGTANRLASALFFDGPDASAVDFLYRNEVPGRPEFNAMSQPLGFRGRGVAVEDDASDPLCSTADPESKGRIAMGADGVLLSCQTGVWRRQGSAFWKDPVSQATALPPTRNRVGDVRLTTDTSRAFAWTGAAWKALAVDQNGDLDVPGIAGGQYLRVSSVEVVGQACTLDGLISRSADGPLLTCRDGRWRSQATQELAYTETGGSVVMRSDVVGYPAGTVFYDGPFQYDAPNDTITATVERALVPTRDGLIITNVNAAMSNGNVSGPDGTAQMTLLVQVVDRDNGRVLAANRAMSPRLVNDIATLAVTLSKAVPRNRDGYLLRMQVFWTTYRSSFAGNFYRRANYRNAFGDVVELTPLQLDWSIDLTY
jgi:type II secretory pathway component PulJ